MSNKEQEIKALVTKCKSIIESNEHEVLTKMIADIALSVLEKQDVIGRPVAWLNDAYLARGVVDGEAGEDDAGPGYIPVYRHPQNATPQPSTNPQIDNDGWIEWGGGECPVDENTRVHFRCRDGEDGSSLSASKISWFHDGSGEDIIAYRVIENDGREG